MGNKMSGGCVFVLGDLPNVGFSVGFPLKTNQKGGP